MASSLPIAVAMTMLPELEGQSTVEGDREVGFGKLPAVSEQQEMP